MILPAPVHRSLQREERDQRLRYFEHSSKNSVKHRRKLARVHGFASGSEWRELTHTDVHVEQHLSPGESPLPLCSK